MSYPSTSGSPKAGGKKIAKKRMKTTGKKVARKKRPNTATSSVNRADLTASAAAQYPDLGS